jgi:hypothetical protein
MNASERVIRVWGQRMVAEYRSAALTAELLHQLIILGVSQDTLATCHRIVSDELAHAELSLAVQQAAGAATPPPPLPQNTLSAPAPPGLTVEQRVLRTCGRVFCCGETVAVPLFRALRAEATQADANRALDRILADEAVHRAFGWDLLDELLERRGDEARSEAKALLPGWLDGLARGYPEAGSDACAEADRAWGLIASRRYGQIRAACVADTILPWFAKRGITPS